MQVLKEQVQQSIEEAALREFASRGVTGASIAKIAKAAGVSTGNVYRYFPDKRALLDAVLPESFARLLQKKVAARMQAAAGLETPIADRHFLALGEELVQFVYENQPRILILLRWNVDTPYAGFEDRLAGSMCRLAERYGRSLGYQPLTNEKRQALHLIYRSYLLNLTELLASNPSSPRFRLALDAYVSYHLHGLRGFFHE